MKVCRLISFFLLVQIFFWSAKHFFLLVHKMFCQLRKSFDRLKKNGRLTFFSLVEKMVLLVGKFFFVG